MPHPRLSLGFLFAALVGSGFVYAQTTATTSKETATATQSVTNSVHADRDAYWDRVAESVPPGMEPVSCSADYDMAWEPSDLNAHVSNRVILTGTLTQVHTRWSASARSRHVEATFDVDQIFQDLSKLGHLKPGQEVSLLSYGGSSDIPTSKDLSLTTNECEDALKLGHKYLLVLTHVEKGDFYKTFDSWDISDGTVRANGSIARYVAMKGHSALDGIPASQLDSVVPKLLSNAH
jgi:hypothetical protein